MNKWFLIILALCLFTASSCTQKFAVPEMNNAQLICVRYTASGNENDNIYDACVQKNEDHELCLQVRRREYYTEPVIVSNYTVSPDILDRIAAIIKAHNMTAWADREDEFFVCDAAHPYLSWTYLTENQEQKYVSISAYIKMNTQELNAYRTVLNILFENEKEDFLIERKQEEQYD